VGRTVAEVPVPDLVSVLVDFFSGQGLAMLISWPLLDVLASPGVDVIVAYVPMLVSGVVNELEITSNIVSVLETGLEKVVAEV
jgi:hypothetical protein